MTVSELIDDLIKLKEEHGDLDVYAVVSTCEYSVNYVFHAKEGPLENIGTAEGQPDLPERIGLELKLL